MLDHKIPESMLGYAESHNFHHSVTECMVAGCMVGNRELGHRLKILGAFIQQQLFYPYAVFLRTLYLSEVHNIQYFLEVLVMQ